MKRIAIMVGAGVLALGLAVPASAGPVPGGFGRGTLSGFAALPAATFVPGSEPSGSLLGTAPVNGVTPPFAAQPVQGFSGIADRHDGSYDVLSDNGYGNKANSSDFLLRVHRIKPEFRAKKVEVLGGFNLSDPYRKVPFALTRADRTLTGSDFDVESIVHSVDGTYWFGDEFGPFLLHTDAEGRLLDAPIELPGVRAPENPNLHGGQPNIGGSKGFEGMIRSVDGRKLYPMLEGTVAGDPAGTLRIQEFNIRKRAYTGQRWAYKLDDPANAIGDAIAVDKRRFLIIERDGGQGDTARTKRIYLADTRDRDHDGLLDKTLVADLLDLADPRGLGGPAGGTFRFPFQTIEDVIILADDTIGVLNDNNFPFSSGRTPGLPDNDEFITIKLAQSLKPDPRVYR